MLVAGGAASLVAWTSTPQATSDRDAENAETVQLAPQLGRGLCLPPRPPQRALGEWSDSVLWVDNRLIGSTLPGTYYRVDLRPGRHVLRGDGPDVGRFTLDTRSGGTHLVSLNVRAGTSHFAVVAAEVGKRDLLRCCSLMENWAPGQRPLLR